MGVGAGDGQSQTNAALRGTACRIDAVEGAEYLLEQMVRDPGAVVADDDVDHVSRLAEIDFRAAPVFHGILQQIAQRIR